MALLASACLAGGCRIGHYGLTADKFSPAQTPAGVGVHLVVGKVPLTGELIEVRDEALVILAGKRLRLVPYAVVRSFHAAQTDVSISGGRAPSPQDRERLRLLSRFPQGLAPDLLNRLLGAYGQVQLAGPAG
jgi:hypothetical protein